MLGRGNSHRQSALLQGEDLVQDERLPEPRRSADRISDFRPLLRLKLAWAPSRTSSKGWSAVPITA